MVLSDRLVIYCSMIGAMTLIGITMSVYSIGYGTKSTEQAKAIIEEVLNGSKAVKLNEECWFLDTALSKNEVIDTLSYIAELDEPFCTVTRLCFGDWLQKAYTTEVMT